MSSQRPRQSLFGSMLTLLVPLGLGGVAAWVGEGTIVGALGLMAEPLVYGLGLYIVFWLLWEKQTLTACTLVMGLILGGVVTHLPAHPLSISEVEVEWVHRLRRCSGGVDQVVGPVRIMNWTLDPTRAVDKGPEDLLAEQPDIIVMQGVVDAQLGEDIATALGGESLFVQTEDNANNVSLVVRGAFQYCGGVQDRWELSLPSTGGRSAGLLTTFPHVQGVGVIPLMVVKLDRMGPPGEWTTWPERLSSGVRQTAAVARAVGTAPVLLVGDFAAPRSFRKMSGVLLGTGLHEIPVPPTWPSKLGPVPLLPVHALDRVWAGAGWMSQGAYALKTDTQSRDIVIVDLGPTDVLAL